jgi:RNA polymerase sigma factor (TIGR02999 family)
MRPDGEVTILLRAWREGDPGALDALMPLVYPVLRGLAAGQLINERRSHTLQPTELVNEAFLRLVKADEVDWRNRVHFLAISARLMRQILVDHARSRGYAKRGGGVDNVPLEEVDPSTPPNFEDLLDVHLALEALALKDARKAQIVELRFFGGLTNQETAEVLQISEETVNRDWRLAKAWLLRHITERGGACG